MADLGRLRREDKHKKAQEVKEMLLGLFFEHYDTNIIIYPAIRRQ
ncbi:hypothetical protein EMIT019CA3_10062 [Bacillus pseudomycoides]